MDVLAPDVNTVLLARLDETHTAVELLADCDVERLIAIVWEGAYDPPLEAWAATGGDLCQLELISVGSQMRGPVHNEARDPLARVLPTERIDRLSPMIDSILENGSIERQAVLIEGIHQMLERGGLDHTYAVIEQLVRSIGRGERLLVLAIPEIAPAGVAAGFAHQFQCVLEAIEDGDASTLQPAGRLSGRSTAEIFDLLEPPRRRILLRVMDAIDGPASVHRLAEHVAGHPIGTFYADDLDRLHTVLFQVDLPKLADHEIVDFDPSKATGTIRLEALQLWPFLELSRRMEGI